MNVKNNVIGYNIFMAYRGHVGLNQQSYSTPGQLVLGWITDGEINTGLQCIYYACMVLHGEIGKI